MEKSKKIEFLKRIFSNPDWKRGKVSFDHLMGHPIWWRVDGKISRARLRPSRKAQASCYRNVLKGLKKANQTHRMERFECVRNLMGLACPIMKAGEVVGLVGVCHTDPAKLKAIIPLFGSTLNTLAKTTKTEMELADLRKTIHPRSLALSTAHTIHRIVGLTLNIDELLPKIARLTLQTLKAKRCSIMLVDKARRSLVPKAGIGLRKGDVGRYRLHLGKGIPGRVAKTGSFCFGRRVLCAPLIEEDVIGVITVWEREDKLPFASTDQELLSVLAEQTVIAIRNAQLYEEQQRLTMGTIKSLVAALDYKTPHKYTPSPELIDITLAMAKELRLSEEELETLRYATFLHDAGKISISEDILAKPSGLTDKEYESIKKHPYRGAKLIKPLDVLKPIVPIILYHHEKYDGTGYPKGLKKDQIPLGARIMAVVDAFWAMTSKRPYRKKVSIQRAVDEIKKNSGTQFDPKVVETFLEVVKRPEIRQKLRGKKLEGVKERRE